MLPSQSPPYTVPSTLRTLEPRRPNGLAYRRDVTITELQPPKHEWWVGEMWLVANKTLGRQGITQWIKGRRKWLFGQRIRFEGGKYGRQGGKTRVWWVFLRNRMADKQNKKWRSQDWKCLKKTLSLNNIFLLHSPHWGKKTRRLNRHTLHWTVFVGSLAPVPHRRPLRHVPSKTIAGVLGIVSWGTIIWDKMLSEITFRTQLYLRAVSKSKFEEEKHQTITQPLPKIKHLFFFLAKGMTQRIDSCQPTVFVLSRENIVMRSKKTSCEGQECVQEEWNLFEQKNAVWNQLRIFHLYLPKFWERKQLHFWRKYKRNKKALW